MSDKPRRRDPRTERTRGVYREGAREVPDEAPRRRRDPRAERGDRRGAAREAIPRTDPGPLVVEHPPGWVLAVPDLHEGRLSDHDRDALGGARILADAHGGGVAVLAFGVAGADLDAAGADRVLYVVEPSGAYDPESRAQALQWAVERFEPWHVVLPDTPCGAGDLGRRVAARLREGVASDVRRLESERVVSRGDGNRSEYHLRPPRFVLVAPEGAEPYAGWRREGRPVEGPAAVPGSGLVDEGPLAVDPRDIPLAEADFILSAGNGVTDWTPFHRLSAALGAAEGGSRVVCDAGLLPRERQVGISGTLVGARCYLALGISGAPQHLQGIERCEHVIAVNTDPHAPIMKRANLAVVGDVQAVMAELLTLVEEGEANGN